jgi:thiamine-monophosphate kinase
MIDISDGLSSEIMHLCKQSKVVVIYMRTTPIDPTFINVCEESISTVQQLLNGGEDYELLFTIAM